MPASMRMATEADAAAVLGIYGPYCESTVISFEYAPPTVGQVAERISQITAHYPWLVLEEDGVVGYAYASRHAERAAYGWSVDTAVYIRPSHHRCGVGRALYATLFAVLRLQGYFKAYAGVTLPNAASVALHEAMGFERVGVFRGVGYKRGAWHDVAWFQMRLQPERPEPPAPVGIAEIVNTPLWFNAVSDGLTRYSGR
jgi:phosphinothricin acetyltransferase